MVVKSLAASVNCRVEFAGSKRSSFLRPTVVVEAPFVACTVPSSTSNRGCLPSTASSIWAEGLRASVSFPKVGLTLLSLLFVRLT